RRACAWLDSLVSRSTPGTGLPLLRCRCTAGLIPLPKTGGRQQVVPSITITAVKSVVSSMHDFCFVQATRSRPLTDDLGENLRPRHNNTNAAPASLEGE